MGVIVLQRRMHPHDLRDYEQRQNAIKAISADAFPESRIEGLARRITTLSRIRTTPEMVREYLDGKRLLGTYERAALGELIVACEKNVGKDLG
jgi:hypothetical protein